MQNSEPAGYPVVCSSRAGLRKPCREFQAGQDGSCRWASPIEEIRHAEDGLGSVGMCSHASHLRRVDVVIAEDDPDMRRLVRSFLQLQGMTVREAPNGEAAWSLLESRRPEVLVTDWQMPLLDGSGLRGRVRNSSRYHHLPIVALSGTSDPCAFGDVHYVKKDSPLSCLAAEIVSLALTNRQTMLAQV